MRITIEVPDEHIDGALAEPSSLYWALEASWRRYNDSPEGWVLERGGAADGAAERHLLGAARLKKALGLMYHVRPVQFAKLASGQYDGETGDLLLQLMAFGEMKYG